MYNSIYPVNINYTNRNKYKVSTPANGEKSYAKENENKNSNTFPNGTKVAIDYTKGQINISQVVTDFRSTIIAINAPENVSEEVNLYLGLVEKESLKEEPSKDIILSNLKNASKICDNYIASSLNKPSKVVEGWIDALFMQKINLKSDPNEINPDFLLEFPKKAQEKIDTLNPDNPQQKAFLSATTSVDKNIAQPEEEKEDIKDEIKIQPLETFDTQIVPDEEINIESDIDENSFSGQNNLSLDKDTSENNFFPIGESDSIARQLFIQAKQEEKSNAGDTNKLNLLNEALGILSKSSNVNENIKAAIHFERGRIFDEYDYVDYALRDYHEASRAQDNNLKAQAYFKSGKIYDEFNEFSPALDNYLSCVAYSGQAENYNAQSLALNSIAGLYASRYNSDKTAEYSELAIDTIQSTNNDTLIAKTYSDTAKNYELLGDNDRALNGYKNALSIFSRTDESYEQMAHNYEQAANVMEKLGNKAKALKLQAKADLYYQKAQQQQVMSEAVS